MTRKSGGFCLFVALTTVLFGQGERATLTGSVTDSTKAAVPDAQIVLRNTATNVVTRTTTNT